MTRFGSGGNEGISLILRDGFDDLDRIMYLTKKDYVNSVAYTDDFAVETLVEQKVAVCLFKSREFVNDAWQDFPLGDRLRRVVAYAISKGANMQLGDIDSGIKWVTVEYRNQTCGEIVRDIMLLLVEYQLWLDHSTTPPTLNMQHRDDLATKVLDLDAGDIITDLDIAPVVDGKAAGVVIQYETPISINGKDRTFLVIDSAGATEGKDVLYETIGLNSGDYTPEYNHVKTRAIPQENASEDTVVKWWVKNTPE